MNIQSLIERGAARLEAAGVAFGHGTNNAFDEAAWLTLWRLGLPLDDLDDVVDELVVGCQLDRAVRQHAADVCDAEAERAAVGIARQV